MKQSFIEDDEYTEEEEMDEMEDDLEDDIELDIFDEEDDDLNQISSYWKSDNDSGGNNYGRKKRGSRFEINDGF